MNFKNTWLRKLENIFALLFFLIPGISLAKTVDDSTIPPGYSLVWSDEFNQGVMGRADDNVWNYELGRNSHGNNELETYTDDTANVAIHLDPGATDNKVLAITAYQSGPGYTSGRIDTRKHKSFQYGYIEARIQIPYGQGIWPAFWMIGDNGLGWPKCGEIDIMENIGKDKDMGTCHGSMHGPGYSGGQCLTGHYVLPDGKKLKDGYHIFAVLWEKDSVQFYSDGQLYETRTPADLPAGTEWVYNHSFFIILNLAIGGYWPGNPDGTTLFPQTMKVDYVRVYQKPSETNLISTVSQAPQEGTPAPAAKAAP